MDVNKRMQTRSQSRSLDALEEPEFSQGQGDQAEVHAQDDIEAAAANGEQQRLDLLDDDQQRLDLLDDNRREETVEIDGPIAGSDSADSYRASMSPNEVVDLVGDAIDHTVGPVVGRIRLEMRESVAQLDAHLKQDMSHLGEAVQLLGDAFSKNKQIIQEIKESMRVLSDKIGGNKSEEIMASIADQNSAQAVNQAVQPIKQSLEELMAVVRRLEGNSDAPTQSAVAPTHHVTESAPVFRGIQDRVSLQGVSSTHSGCNMSLKRTCKMPPFDGSEKWTIYYERLESTARHYGWSEADKLRELEERLTGKAAQYVYDELPREMRQCYSQLTQKLADRFQDYEMPRTYFARLNNCHQKQGEDLKVYAAELKRLYMKTYPDQKDVEQMRQDLVQRFFQGLADDTARINVEMWIGSTANIDDAVKLVMKYQETSKPVMRSGRMARKINEENEDIEEQEQNNIRANKGGIKESQFATRGKELSDGEILRELLNHFRNGNLRLVHEGQSVNFKGLCYNCREPGHVAADCIESTQPRSSKTSKCVLCGREDHDVGSCPVSFCPKCGGSHILAACPIMIHMCSRSE